MSRIRLFLLFWHTATVALHIRNLFFIGATHHCGLADIVKKRNPRIRSRISRKSIPGTANGMQEMG
ncbi:MAG: hypothetical protein ACETWQ_15230 [Phycisphaerae bacterium]